MAIRRASRSLGKEKVQQECDVPSGSFAVPSCKGGVAVTNASYILARQAASPTPLPA